METASKITSKLLKGQNILKMLTYLNLTGYLFDESNNVKDGECFDFVIVGGGTSGCILASNLAKMNATVALIEYGTLPTLETQLPALFPYLKGTEYDWNLTSSHDMSLPYQKENHSDIHQGRVLGGCSQVNYMMYGIGNPKDYNEWATITNDSSWSFKKLCPLFKRTERVVDKKILNSPDVLFHGTKGKLRLKKYHHDINNEYFESYKELGHKVVNDINPHNTLGFTSTYFTIGNHVRQSTFNAFLSPEKDNPNLHVMLNSLATKIIFDKNKHAVGVRVLTKDNKYITVKAKKEVIVTAGTIKSAHLLMLSGIGPKKHLESKNIKVISNLPVGQNFQDHPTCTLLYKMGKAKPETSVNPQEFPAALMVGYVAINESKGRADYHVISGVTSNPVLFLQLCSFTFNFKNDVCDRLYKSLGNRQMHYNTHILLYSDSRGEILLNSKDPKDKPLIYPQYYRNKKDLERHAKYVEHYNAIVNTSYYKSVNAELVDPELETCDGLKKGTNAYWRCYVRGMGTTLHNYVGTCAMGSVVDSKFRVKGVKNLRVGDASVMPRIVGSTVQATVMMFAQKLTDLLIEHHQLCSQ